MKSPRWIKNGRIQETNRVINNKVKIVEGKIRKTLKNRI